jgi:hypothetical protein
MAVWKDTRDRSPMVSIEFFRQGDAGHVERVFPAPCWACPALTGGASRPSSGEARIRAQAVALPRRRPTSNYPCPSAGQPENLGDSSRSARRPIGYAWGGRDRSCSGRHQQSNASSAPVSSVGSR